VGSKEGGDPVKLYNSKTVARFIDVTERRVRQLRDEGVISEARPGLCDLTDTNHKYINYLRQRNPDRETNIDYNTERAKLVRAKRKNEEYDLRVKARQLHASKNIELVMTNMLINFKMRMLSIPAKLSPALSKKTDRAEIFEILKTHIDEALSELSDFNKLFEKAEQLDGESDD
jgi:hypothetical protein